MAGKSSEAGHPCGEQNACGFGKLESGVEAGVKMPYFPEGIHQNQDDFKVGERR